MKKNKLKLRYSRVYTVSAIVVALLLHSGFWCCENCNKIRQM